MPKLKKELAVTFVCTKFHDYIYEQKFVIVETDHKPLEAILKKPLFLAPPRLQKMIMTLQKYPLEVKYCPGKELFVADTLSRAALQEEASKLDYKFDIFCVNLFACNR